MSGTSGAEPTLSGRDITGYGNNVVNPEWGSIHVQLGRLSPATYEDGESALVTDRPNPRAISNAVVAQTEETPNSFGASNLLWGWGQFLDHDLDLTPEGESFSDFAPIVVPFGDPLFPTGSIIPFNRSEHVEGTGENGVPLEHENAITSFIDASNVYGSDPETEALLRVEGGKMLIRDDGLLETTDDPTDGDGLLAGDVRAGENVVLTSLHTLFVHEHNRLVDQFKADFPDMTDDELYLAAKARVEGMMQAITYNEFLPLLLGENAIPEYTGYDETVDPGIVTEFSTVVFRVGHTLLSTLVARRNEDGSTVEEGDLTLRNAFESPSLLEEAGGIAAVFRGVAATPAQEVDNQIIEDVRSFLFGIPGAGGLDLGSLNIQRARDHGIASYNDMREALGLERKASFDDISSDPQVNARLASVYVSVDDIDAWVGGLAEDPVGGGQVGELFSTVLIDQFVRTRDGDRFWSESFLSEEEVEEIWNTTLSDIIERNTDVGEMQRFAMIATNRIGGTEDGESLTGTDSADLVLGFGGDDTLNGGAGNDELSGGAGTDTFEVSLGDGNTIIRDDGDNGVLELSAEIKSFAVDFTAGGFGDQDLVITLLQTGETIEIEDQFADGDDTGVDTISFGDGTVLSVDESILNAGWTQVEPTVAFVNDWSNPNWGGGYIVGFELSLSDVMVADEGVSSWSFVADLEDPKGYFKSGWVADYGAAVSFDPETGRFSTSDQAYTLDLDVGQSMTFFMQVEGTGFEMSDFSFYFQDSDPITSASDDGASSELSVDASRLNDWGRGFVQTVTVTNSGAEAVDGWVTRLDLEDGVLETIDVSSVWGAAVKTNGEDLFFYDAGYNSTLGANGSTGFGFGATLLDANGAPFDEGDFTALDPEDVTEPLADFNYAGPDTFSF